MEKHDLEKIYDGIYSDSDISGRNSVFNVVCRNFFSKLLPQHSTDDVLVDIAAGHCDFVNNILWYGKKFACDINEYSKRTAAPDVTVIIDDVIKLREHFEKESISLFFTSNFIEHIPRDTMRELFAQCYELLKPNGELWVMMPNIRFIGGEYWDYIDHITPLTDRSVRVVGEMFGFKTKLCMPKFLPYSMIYSRLPSWPILVKLYLKLMPLSSFFLGKQCFLIFKK